MVVLSNVKQVSSMKILLGKRAENISWGLLALLMGAVAGYFWLSEGNAETRVFVFASPALSLLFFWRAWKAEHH